MEGLGRRRRGAGSEPGQFMLLGLFLFFFIIFFFKLKLLGALSITAYSQWDMQNSLEDPSKVKPLLKSTGVLLSLQSSLFHRASPYGGDH